MSIPPDHAASPRAAARDGVAAGTVAVCAQIAPRLGDLPTNLGTHAEILRDAAGAGADLVLFPELSLTGYFLRDLVPDVAIRIDGPELAGLAAVAPATAAIVGCVIETDDHRFLNAAVLLHGGRAVLAHAKVHLPTYGLFDERRYLAPGDRLRPLAVPGPDGSAWRAGVLVCEDIWHPAAVVVLARAGMELLLVQSASPGRGIREGRGGLGTARSYAAITQAHAQLTTAYLLFCNRVGYEEGIGFWGGSRLVGPDGELCGTPAEDTEALCWFRLDPAAVRRARVATPLLRDERTAVIDAELARLRRLEEDRP